MPISFPTNREEQQAIATFFRSLDRKIALETARLEKLKQIKLACLDKCLSNFNFNDYGNKRYIHHIVARCNIR